MFKKNKYETHLYQISYIDMIFNRFRIIDYNKDLVLMSKNTKL